jgi:hypothetical protein
MQVVMVALIVFPAVRDRQEISIRKVNAVDGESSWKNLTGTATIKLPSSIYFQDKKVSLKDFIKRGDPVEINLGYNETYHKRFEGFVAHVSPQIPVEITCEDYMYKLKHTPVNKSYQSIRLPQLLANICPSDITINAIDIDLGSFKAPSTNVAKVLEKIKEQYGVVAYFKDKKLFVGKVYLSNTSKSPVALFHFQRNVKSHNLEYREKDEIKYNVEAISNLKSGKKIKVDVGDKDGEKRTLNYYNITSEAELEATATRDMEKLKVEGYRGSIDTFGQPLVEHTDVVKLEDDKYPEKNGNYFVDGVKFSFTSSGYENTLEIGGKAS